MHWHNESWVLVHSVGARNLVIQSKRCNCFYGRCIYISQRDIVRLYCMSQFIRSNIFSRRSFGIKLGEVTPNDYRYAQPYWDIPIECLWYYFQRLVSCKADFITHVITISMDFPYSYTPRQLNSTSFHAGPTPHAARSQIIRHHSSPLPPVTLAACTALNFCVQA